MVRDFWNEEWKNIVFDEAILDNEHYKISSYGRLAKVENKEDMLIEKQYTINGYNTVKVIKKDGKKTSRYLHKIIAQHFLEQPENAKYVIHLDYNKKNNKVENLKWATKRQKEIHQFSNPLYKTRKKITPSAKLTETEVMRLKKRLLDPNRRTRLKLLAKEFGVSEMQLHRIKTGENWSHIKV